MFPNKPTRFREGRHMATQANDEELEQMENDMRDLGAYRMSGNSRNLIEPDRTPRKLYGDFPAIPDTPNDYERRTSKDKEKGKRSPTSPTRKSPKKPPPSQLRQNRAIGGKQQGRKSERPLTRLEKEQEYAAVKLQSMQRGRSQRATMFREEQEKQEQIMLTQKQSESRSASRSGGSLRERRRQKSRESSRTRSVSRNARAESFPTVNNQADQPESEYRYGEMDNEKERGYSENGMGMVPSQPSNPNSRRSSPSPRKARAKSLNIDFDAVEQVRLKLKQACSTHKGCEPSKLFDKWDKDKDGELDRDEVHEGMTKLLGKDVLSEWDMFPNFFKYVDADGDGTIDRDEFCEFVTTKPQVKVTRRRSQQINSKQAYENFSGTFQGDKHKGGQKGFGSHSDVDKKKKTYYKERTGTDSNTNSNSNSSLSPRSERGTRDYKRSSPTGSVKSLEFNEIDFDAVEQLRLKLKVACTTHKGVEPSKLFDKWDKDKDGELDRDEVLEGMNKLLGRDVLSEWDMFPNFFAYVDTDGDGTIDRDEFAEFVTTRPDVKVVRRQSQQINSKQVFEGFHGSFQGDKHKGGQKGFGAYGDVDKKQKSYYKERTGIDSTREVMARKTNTKEDIKNLDFNAIDFDAVEQLRLKLKVACTTHKGVEPSRLFDKWDKDKDGELDRDEVLEGMNKLLGKDVLDEWNMFENFFSYVDTDGDGTIDRNEFAEFVTTQPNIKVTRRRSEAYESPKQVFENFQGTFQGDKHKGGQKGFGAYGDVDKKQRSYYNERSGRTPPPTPPEKKRQLGPTLNFDEIDFDAVEQIRLKLKIACTTHKGVQPSKLFDKWDKDKDGELDREEVLEGMSKLLGKDVLEEWDMFPNFFAYIDTDQNGTIDRDEFCEFVTTKPEVKVTRRKSQQSNSKQVFENFSGTFQGDKHKGGQKGFGSYGDKDKKQKTYYVERTGMEPAYTEKELRDKKKKLNATLEYEDIDFDAVEQLRLKLKRVCTTHNGLEPNKLFNKWDKDKDGELDREEVLEGMNKLLGKDVLDEWDMFQNFFSYIDTDGNGTIDNEEFEEFVRFKPEVKITRRKSDLAESPRETFEKFHGTFQGDKHKGGQKSFGKVSGDGWDYKENYGRD